MRFIIKFKDNFFLNLYIIQYLFHLLFGCHMSLVWRDARKINN